MSFYYPQHLGIPTVGEAYPLTARPLAAGPLNFLPPNTGGLGARIAAATGGTLPPASTGLNLGSRVAAAGGMPATTPAPFTPTPAASGGLLQRFNPLSKLSRPGLLKGAGVGIATELAADPIGNLVGGGGVDNPGFDRADLGQGAAGATRGAGLGYALGGGWGALAGGILGAGAGALDVFGSSGPLKGIGGFFGGGGVSEKDNPYSTPNIKKNLNQFLQGSGLDEKTRGVMKKTTLAQLEAATTDEERAAILNNTVTAVQQSALQQRQAQDQLANSLALQAQAARIFQPFAEANQRTASMAADVYSSMKQNLTPGLGAVADMFAFNAQQQADLMTQGLYTTALAKPRIDALVAQQQQIDSIAAQIVQQASAQAAAGGGGGGGVDIEALMASVG